MRSHFMMADARDRAAKLMTLVEAYKAAWRLTPTGQSLRTPGGTRISRWR
jgi:hypothetical protein